MVKHECDILPRLDSRYFLASWYFPRLDSRGGLASWLSCFVDVLFVLVFSSKDVLSCELAFLEVSCFVLWEYHCCIIEKLVEKVGEEIG